MNGVDAVEIDLDARGLEHVRARLAQGRSLGALLLEKLDLRRGEVSTYLPPGVPLEGLYDFEDGVLPEPPEETHRVVVTADGRPGRLVPVPNMNLALAAILFSYLAVDSRRICLFVHPFAEASDPWLTSAPLRVATLGQEVYFVLTAGEGDVAGFIRCATSLWWSAILTSLPDLTRMPAQRVELTLDLLGALAERTDKIIVEAYDGEGFLVWSPEQPTSEHQTRAC